MRTAKAKKSRGGWWRVFLGLALIAPLLSSCGSDRVEPGNEVARKKIEPGASVAAVRQNVVVILIDTLRPDHLGFGGHSRETAPYLASLAEKSVVFTRAVSTSTWTAPATASLFTGLHPLRHGVQLGIVAHHKRLERDAISGVSKLRINRMPESISTLPELFRGLGYRTFGIAANPNIGSAIGFDRGFDRFELLESRPISAAEARAAGRPNKPFRWANGEELYLELSSWKREIISGGDPFFLYIHINDVHDPYEMHPRFYRSPGAEDSGRALYDSGIGYVDEILARVHADFELDENTIIAVVSDHGEAFGEHGYHAHRQGVYGETNRILWLLSAPGLGLRADRVAARVSIMGVLPTLLELVGAERPLNRDGLSVVPLMRFENGGDSPEREALERELNQRVLVVNRVAQNPDAPVSWAVMKGRWKWIHDGDRVELYDLDMDLEEHHNLILKHPDVSGELRRILAAFRERTDVISPRKVDLLLDSETVEALKTLGYGD